MSSFKDLRIVDNFYQTSLFFPMPTVIISTIAESGETNLGPYSLVQPYYVAGRDYYAMLLNARNSSNTAQNILRTGKCAINFIPDDRKYFKEAVKLSWPGDTTEEKMPKCKFRLEEGLMAAADPSEPRPKVLTDAFQVIECTWMSDLDKGYECKPGELHGYQPPYHDFNGITSEFGATFILRVDKILMKERYYNAIINAMNDLRGGDWSSLAILLPYVIGLILGIVFIAKLMNFLLKKHAALTFCAIFGLVIGSPAALLMQNRECFPLANAGNWIACAVCLAIGFAVAWFISALDRKPIAKQSA